MSNDYSELLALIAENGNLSLSCRKLGIAKSTFLNAVDANEELMVQYARAKERGIDAMMEELLDAEIDDPAKARLEWDRKRWHASKLFRKRYGEKQEIEHSGVIDTSSKEQRDAAVAAALRADG